MVRRYIQEVYRCIQFKVQVSMCNKSNKHNNNKQKDCYLVISLFVYTITTTTTSRQKKTKKMLLTVLVSDWLTGWLAEEKNKSFCCEKKKKMKKKKEKEMIQWEWRKKKEEDRISLYLHTYYSTYGEINDVASCHRVYQLRTQ